MAISLEKNCQVTLELLDFIIVVLIRWLEWQQVLVLSKTEILMGHYPHSSSVDATIMASKDSVPTHW